MLIQKSGVGFMKLAAGRQKTEDRRLKTEDGRPEDPQTRRPADQSHDNLFL